jgi:hypothetical protein
MKVVDEQGTRKRRWRKSQRGWGGIYGSELVSGERMVNGSLCFVSAEMTKGC